MKLITRKKFMKKTFKKVEKKYGFDRELLAYGDKSVEIVDTGLYLDKRENILLDHLLDDIGGLFLDSYLFLKGENVE